MSSKDPNDLLFEFDPSVAPSELQPFAPEEMVRCEECLRANSPTRIACLYCGTALPENLIKTAAAVKAAARTPEPGQSAFNLILSSSSTVGDDSIEKAAAVLRLNANDLTRLVRAKVTL